MHTALFIGPDYAPALGDVRERLPGDTVYIKEGATERRDWGRYLDALSVAITRGASVVWWTS
ncbi:gp5 [Streptomyces phage phiBT1]|uniref:Gp5 n=1 Tax=Lomovskayavirus BT1 TaxID=225588 RepID=Q858Z5_9CAUD|nr:gp5 [Streptomyces phage phiBT1]CAD80130.1 gp5 [Lomovskayavirus BT1]